MNSHYTNGQDNIRAWLIAALLMLAGAAAGTRVGPALQWLQTVVIQGENTAETELRGERVHRIAGLTGGQAQVSSRGVADTLLQAAVGEIRRIEEETARNEEQKRREAMAADWRLLLVNKEHPLPEDYEVRVTYTELGYQIDERCVDELEQMLQDCRKAGHDPKICSAYRDRQYQINLFNNSIWNYQSRGYSYEEARALTAEEVAVPGTSEHELGLAVDLVSYANQRLNEEQENTGAQKWLMENSWKYGWILRYPTAKKDITGIIYEPWHYRYVGREYAREIYEKGLCLEEFLAQ